VVNGGSGPMTPRMRELGRRIKLVLSDVDGVLTDGGVYYGARGEELKRFDIRDGMGVERLRNAGIETGIVTGERSPSVARRAEKLRISLLFLGAKDKNAVLDEILASRGFRASEVAFIGDDVNDLTVLRRVALAAAPSDAQTDVRAVVHYVCHASGGHGAFREFAELILAARDEETSADATHGGLECEPRT